MAYTFDEPKLGMLQINQFDSGYIPANNGTTAIPTPPLVLGGVYRAFDPTYGEGEFILLKGIASTAVGSAVTYDATTYATALAPLTDNLARPVAWAMSANIVATTFGFYQIGGSVVAAKSTNHNLQPNVGIGMYSVGKIATTSSAGAGNEILGARYSGTATAASSATTCVIVVDRPHMQGRIT